MFDKCLILYYTYLIFYYLFNKQNRYIWDSFTRVISTLNSIQCVYMVYCETFYSKSIGMYNIYYIADESSLRTLFWFSSYLFIDGIFQLPDKMSFSLILSILHHFVGSIGIYIIANTKMGFFLGYYFAMTEISTIFLNLSWVLRNKIIFYIFYIFFVLSRIITIPFLLDFINYNSSEILKLIPFYYNMVYYGSYTLLTLNFIWFIFLTKKLFTLK